MVGALWLRYLCHRLWHFCRRGQLGNHRLSNSDGVWVIAVERQQPLDVPLVNALPGSFGLAREALRRGTVARMQPFGSPPPWNDARIRHRMTVQHVDATSTNSGL